MINLRMSSFTYGPIAIESMVPDELSSLIVPNSEPGYSEGPFGKILIQKIELKECTFIYKYSQIKEDLALDFRYHPGNMQIHAALKNDVHYFIQGMGDMYLSEGQFNVLNTEDVEGTSYLEKDNEYKSVHVIYSPAMLETFLPAFPPVEEWLSAETPQPHLLFKTHPMLTSSLKDIIDKVINCQYSGEMREVFTEMKLHEYLFLSLVPVGQNAAPAIRLSKRNIELIYESKHLLEKEFDRHITISSVARKVGLNEFKLKAGFKKIFGISMFEYLIETKMQRARSLLLETDKPIKEIALMTGYSTKQSFLNAFKKFYHDTPGSYRKS